MAESLWCQVVKGDSVVDYCGGGCAGGSTAGAGAGAGAAESRSSRLWIALQYLVAICVGRWQNCIAGCREALAGLRALWTVATCEPLGARAAQEVAEQRCCCCCCYEVLKRWAEGGSYTGRAC